MRAVFRKNAARIAPVILIVCLCALFVCACGEAGTVTIDFSLTGELFPGELLSVELEIKGADSAVSTYVESDCSLEVIEGAEVASVEGEKVRIASTARGGDAFTLRVTVKDVSQEKRFVVVAPAVERVTLLAAESAEAGQSVALSVEVMPEGAVASEPVYTVVSGAGTVEGGVLKISDRADGGEVVLKASVGGVESEEKHILISTVQTRNVFLTLSAKSALPGETVRYVKTKEPAVSSYDIIVSIEEGADVAELDAQDGILRIKEGAPMGSEVVLVARSGYCEARETLRVDYPEVQNISAWSGGASVAPGTERTFEYSVLPIGANPAEVRISILVGAEFVEWSGGTTFHVLTDARQGAEITFLLEASEEVYTTLSYRVEKRTLTSLSIETAGSLAYLKSGESLRFTHQAEPADYDGEVVYRAAEGADLVTINGDTVTVKDGADIGRVVLFAESTDGTRSNEIEFTVSGRYSRRVYSSWANVSLSSAGENASVWMVLPPVLNTGCLTVLVPYEVVDLVIEGQYDGTEESAYRDLYFYFRNAPERTVTLWNFGTVATQGLGGTVMDFGSSGKTEIVLKGANLVKADSPYLLDNSGEVTDGLWNNNYSSAAQKQLRRSGKSGYVGTAGGTAIGGYSFVFEGSGTLVAVAGSGVDGTPGGTGADAAYEEGVSTYLSGKGGDGGHGGDSGAAIFAYTVSFVSGGITVLPGNAGKGGSGGEAGSLSALVGRDVAMLSGGAGAAGLDGVPYPAVRATKISGAFVNATGKVESRKKTYDGTIATLAATLARFYGVGVYYGTALENPYKNYSRSRRYVMQEQTDGVVLMQQANFLMYTMSRIPKNAWREIAFRSGKIVKIYLCKSITSGTGSVILGLTSDSNRVWFATFDTEIRGVYYGGYFNIMLHEFVHAFHYNFSTSARTSFETELKSLNYGLAYKSSYGTGERVYGVRDDYDETNSCFLSNYSRKSVMEDAAETLSIASLFLSLEPPLREGNIRKKFDLLATVFAREYETLSPLKTGKTLFAYSRLFD